MKKYKMLAFLALLLVLLASSALAGVEAFSLPWWTVDGGVGLSHGRVTYKSGRADHAELLPRLDSQERIEARDIVGVFNGRVIRTTRGADQVLVVSSGLGLVVGVTLRQRQVDGR